MTAKRLALGGLLAVLLAPPAPAEDTAVYLDPTKPLEARVADLVGRMTPAEKIDQLSSTAPATTPTGRWRAATRTGLAWCGRSYLRTSRRWRSRT